jgi:hypothetical protein
LFGLNKEKSSFRSILTFLVAFAHLSFLRLLMDDSMNGNAQVAGEATAAHREWEFHSFVIDSHRRRIVPAPDYDQAVADDLIQANSLRKSTFSVEEAESSDDGAEDSDFGDSLEEDLELLSRIVSETQKKDK